jgi:NAD(P)-dependent dehydrogenase (short-subunit alcohol dehydrogenase family)
LRRWRGAHVFDLSGKGALVVGPATPLTRAIAVGLAEAGAEVAVASRDRSEEFAVNSIGNEIWAVRGRSFALPMDATNEEDVSAAVTRAVAELGKIDILVNASDLVLQKPLLETSLVEWQRVIDGNVTATFLACKHAGGLMVRQGQGRIINVSSILGERGVANSVAYGAAKAAVTNLTRALAIEWARTGVTVNTVACGWMYDVPGAGGDEKAVASLERYLPLKHLAQPQDVVGSVIYLATDVSSFMTGEVIFVEGAALVHG